MERVFEHRMRADHRQPEQDHHGLRALRRRRAPQPASHHAPQPRQQQHRHARRAHQTGLRQQIEHGVVGVQGHLRRHAQLRHLLELRPAELPVAHAQQRMRAEHGDGMRPKRAARRDLIAGLQLRDGIE
ncbi:hypothetical protein D3C72_2074330 [compost metagenome]